MCFEHLAKIIFFANATNHMFSQRTLSKMKNYSSQNTANVHLNGRKEKALHLQDVPHWCSPNCTKNCFSRCCDLLLDSLCQTWESRSPGVADCKSSRSCFQDMILTSPRPIYLPSCVLAPGTCAQKCDLCSPEGLFKRGTLQTQLESKPCKRITA